METEELEFIENYSIKELNELMAKDLGLLEDDFGLTVEKELSDPVLSTSVKFLKKYNIEIPFGKLFYPCCGSDIYEPLFNFSEYVSCSCFADPYKPPVLDIKKYKSIKRKFSNRNVAVGSLINVVKTFGVITTGLYNDTLVEVYANDGLITLLEKVKNISIFYYRGDSPGEGGSNQWWLSPVIFHLVLNRLYDGGLIVTDGSNCGLSIGYNEKRVAWYPLCHDNDDSTTNFEYGNRSFNLVGTLNTSRGPLKIWQVYKQG